MRLQPQPFALLELLVARAGQKVTWGEMHRALWPTDTHVAFDTGLNTAMRKLRRALGETAERPRCT